MAAGVMALGVATSITAIQIGLKSTGTARDTTLVSQILQSEIERIRMMSWNTVSALPASDTVDISTIFSADTHIAERFELTRTISLDTTRSSEVATIDLAIAWRSFDGIAHRRTFQSKYVKNGLYDYYYTLARP